MCMDFPKYGNIIVITWFWKIIWNPKIYKSFLESQHIIEACAFCFTIIKNINNKI